MDYEPFGTKAKLKLAFFIVVVVLLIAFSMGAFDKESEYDVNMRYCKEKGLSEQVCVKAIDVYNKYNTPDMQIKR